VFKKFIRFYAAVSPIPFKWHIYRISNRFKLWIYHRLPFLFYTLIQKESDSIVVGVPRNDRVGRLHESIKRYYSGIDYHLVEVGDEVLTLEILGVQKSFQPREISQLPFNENGNQLRRMSLAYCGFLHELLEKTTQSADVVLGSIIDSYSAKKAWYNKEVFSTSWHPYCVSHRLINYISLLLLKQNSNWSFSFDSRILINEILFALVFLQKNIERELHYNHYSKNMIAIYITRVVLGLGVSHSFKKELKYSISHQINSDGMQAELSPMYHLLFLNDLNILCSIRDSDSELNTFFSDTYSRLESVAKLLIFNQSSLPAIGDSWTGEATKPPVKQKKVVTAVLKDSGYLIHHGENLSFLLDFGRAGAFANPGHSHSDFLHCQLYLDGRPILVDYGVPTYTKGDSRNKSRASFVHNGPAILERSLLETWSSFRTGRESIASLVSYEQSGANVSVKASVEPYFKRGLKISREIECSDRTIHIKDSWDAEMLGGLTPYLQFIVPKANVSNLTLQSDCSGRRFLELLGGWTIYFEALEVRLLESEYYSRYGVPEDGVVLSLIPRNFGALLLAELRLTKG